MLLQYVVENPGTLITRFYGMHRVKMKHLKRTLHFVIMQSVFYSDKEIHETYDLKVLLLWSTPLVYVYPSLFRLMPGLMARTRCH